MACILKKHSEKSKGILVFNQKEWEAFSYVKNLENSPQRGQISYGQSIRYSNSEYLYYVITTRVKGAKNSISVVQTIVHF